MEKVIGDVTLKYGTDGHKWLVMGLDSIFSFAQMKIVFMRYIGVDSPADTKFPEDRNVKKVIYKIKPKQWYGSVHLWNLQRLQFN